MKPMEVLVAKSSGKTLLVNGRDDDLIYVIGASVPTSVLPGRFVSSFGLQLWGSEIGVVALSVCTKRFHDRKNGAMFPFLLVIRPDGGDVVRIDLEEQWVPTEFTQVHTYHLEVQIGDEWFSSSKSYPGITRHARHVPDANLLCRYLVGTATADEVRAAAEEAVAEASREKRIVELEAQVKQLEEIRRIMEEHIQELNVRIQRHRDEKAIFHQSATEWRTYAEMLRSILSTRLFLWRDLRQALREFPGTPKPPESPQ